VEPLRSHPELVDLPRIVSQTARARRSFQLARMYSLRLRPTRHPRPVVVEPEPIIIEEPEEEFVEEVEEVDEELVVEKPSRKARDSDDG